MRWEDFRDMQDIPLGLKQYPLEKYGNQGRKNGRHLK